MEQDKSAVIETKTEDQDEVEFEVLVNISNDYYKAYLTVVLHKPSAELTKEDLKAALDKKNVSYGLDYDALDSIVQNPSFADSVLVASGVHHENGKDGELTFYVDKENKIKPKMMANGRVDFKEIEFFHAAVAGDVLAVRTMPIEGKNGMTVTGRNINAKPGKIVNFKIGKNVRVSEDGLQIIADKSGSIQFDGEKISIIEVLEIRGNVGVETGNIHFIGKVIVTGNVTSGYEVSSEDVIEINGIVESAKLVSKGDIILTRGVQGNDNAFIECGGNLQSGFLNNCHVTVKGNIEADSIMHSHITCDGSITAQGKKGQVVGGEINVRKELIAKTIGSEMGTITKIRLGVDSAVMDEYKQAAEAIKEKQDNIKKLTQAVRMLRKQLEASKGNPEIKAMLDKTLVSKDQYNEDLKELQKKFIAVNQLIENLRDARVKVQLVYPGVKVRIGHSYYNVKEVMKGVCIQKDEGEIRTSPY